MLQKWKNILINWINCYFSGSNKKEQNINLESLLGIISHLRENLNLDESKSSVLEANTIEEFILEKYPEFKFENGTIEPTNEEEMYLVASLLLFFVCVISKDVDIKNAMCSKLSAEDQEVLLKFNKSLMECTIISCRDVQNAITDACGQDMGSIGSHSIISATPPALRSLHSEVRRLQAALDAERFDRNYLQEELSRTNLKLEKLLKDKEKYKLDIVNLKSKISTCCGQEAENRAMDAAGEGSSKFIKQLEQIEEKLVETQCQLDDALYERDTYRNKIDTLKQERDKWLSFSQQETTRVSQLTEELEVERRNVLSLRDLVTELRQHNHLNRLDSSQLECDDPDTSIHSMHHNLSICSEVCANVVEVQLGEERAKIVELKQQIQTLQDQLYELNQKSEHEKKMMDSMLKEADIFNLKQRINEEIEEKTNIKVHFDDEISKLNNEMNELEQKLKDSIEQSKHVIDTKMQEIKVVQEEKLLLLESFSDETTKLDNIIKSLKMELDVERNTKMNMKEEYDNHIIKLNEKILNRNNELVELQNNIVEKREQLEDLQAKLRNETQIKEVLEDKYHKELEQLNKQKTQIENMLTQKTQEIKQLQKELHANVNYIDQLNRDVDNLKETISNLREKCSVLEDNKLTLLLEVKNRDAKIEEIQKEVENTNILFKEEKEKCLYDRDEIHNTINVLQTQLQNEIHFKTQLQNELTHLQGIRSSLLIDNNSLSMELSKTKTEIEVKEQTIFGMDLYLKEEKHKNETLKRNNDELDEKNHLLTKEIISKDDTIKEIKNMLEEEKRCHKDEIRKKDELLESEKQKLLDALEEKDVVQADLTSAINEKDAFENDGRQKSIEISLLKDESANLAQIIGENRSIECAEVQTREDRAKIDVLNQQIHTLQDQLNEISQKHEHEKQVTDYLICEKETDIFNLKHRINEEIEEKNNIKARYNDDISKLNNEINELDQKLQDNIEQSRQAIETKMQEITVVQEEKISLLQSLSDETTKLDNIIKKLKAELELERSTKMSMKDEYENHIMKLNEKVLNRNNELVELQNNVFERSEQLEDLHAEIRNERQIKQELTVKYHCEIEQLTEQKMHTESMLEQKTQEVEQLQKEFQERSNYCDQLNSDIDDMKHTISNLRESCRILEENKLTLLLEVKSRDDRVEEVQKEVENTNNMLREENEKWLYDKAEKNETINGLQMQLQNEIDFKTQLQNELINLQEIRTSLFEDINSLNMETFEIKERDRRKGTDCCRNVGRYQYLNMELSKSKKEIEEKDQSVVRMLEDINSLNIELSKAKKEIEEKSQLQNDLIKLQETKTSLLEDINSLNIELSKAKKAIKEKDQTIVGMELHIKEEKDKNEKLKIHNNHLNEKLKGLSEEVTAKEFALREIQNILQEEKKSHEDEINKKDDLIKCEHQKLLDALDEKNALQSDFISVLNERNKFENEASQKYVEILQLKEESAKLTKSLEENRSNASSKVCALNEVEQQEESAKVVELKQEMQDLQEKFIELSQIKENEKQVMESLISEKEYDIFNLKHLINKEIEDKNNLRAHFDDEITKLNNKITKLNSEINELEQKLKENTEQSRCVIESNKEEIKVLQEEKQSHFTQLQSLSNETTKLDNIIKTLKVELDMEKNTKLSMKEEYDNQISKLNEEVLVTNKELVEFQNNVLEKSRQLEVLQAEKRNEKQIEQDLIEKHSKELNQINEHKKLTDNMIIQKTQVIEQLQIKLQEKEAHTNELKRNIDDLNMTISNLKENCRILEETKLTLLLEIKNRDVNVEKIQKEIENTNTKWLQDTDENNVTINALQTQLQNEINYKMRLQNELTHLQSNKDSLLEDINSVNLELSKSKKEIEEKDRIISQLNLNLQEEKHKNEKLKIDSEKLQEKVENISKEITVRDVAVKEIQNMLEEEKKSHKDEIRKKDDLLEFEHQKLLDVLEEKSAVQADLISVIKEKGILEKDASQKSIEVLQLKEESAKLFQTLEENRSRLEDQLLDVTKELEVSKENCHQLSNQLKKIVHQKNEEIAELKKQVSKMTVTENRATQIIKVSSKYQAIILKRITEIKNNSALKELTNFGNSSNCDNEVRRNLYAGTITIEDLENFLETTEKHLRRCSEKQIALQKERERLTEVNKMNESEIINIKKFLTELAVGFKTFNNIKDLYSQKLSRIVSVQRTVRREILNLDGHITDATMCKLERGYAAVMQDLSECSMNMERWVERSIDRTISPEIKQAFSSDSARASLASISYQNTSLEIQLEELEKSFQKLLEEVIRAQKGEGAKDAQSVTVMEVRAEYEDKLNRMKAKMKELYHEQIAVFQSRQKEEIAALERELQKAEKKLSESSRAYEEHIRVLTTELWTVGEKFLMKQDEAEWLRRKQHSGSLMSLQHVHSSGLAQPIQGESSRPSDTYSIRSLPVFNNNTNNKREGRGLHMSDEEGEVFDNRCLKELTSTPRRSPPGGLRLSELRWRNSLCPPHLKSSYPAETQFAPAIDEDDIKCANVTNGGGRQQRKEVGITAYKKPGPPTPSKQAGRLSATDSELRESLRVEMDPQPSRKTSTPSRIRALFRSAKNDTIDGTPRKRLSIFKKK
ncbi:LOW QUALITY PROTEIN: uncharacterized protein ACR2FA_009360 [Aphomia sociella]